jgi:hypothetical protein
MLLPGVAALLFPAAVWGGISGAAYIGSGEGDGLSLELVRTIGALFLGSGISLWLFLAEIEGPNERQRSSQTQVIIALALILSFVHMALSTSANMGVLICIVWTAIPLVLNSRAILSFRGDTPQS